MAEDSWPSPAHASRAVNDAEYEQILSSWRLDGVAGTSSDSRVAYADSSGRQVKVRAGKYALIRGHVWYSGTTEFTRSFATNTSGSTRIDRLVYRLDRSTWQVTTAVLQGTPGGGVAPSPTQQTGSSGVWEVPILRATLINGYTTIAPGDIKWEIPYLGPHPVVGMDADSRPTNPLIGQRHFRTDRNWWETWTGTEWVPDMGTCVLNANSTNISALGLDNSERDVWTFTWAPECTGTYLIKTATPYDGTTGEQAKYRLYFDGGEVKQQTVEMKAGANVDFVDLDKTVDCPSIGNKVIKVTAIRTSGSNFFQSRLAGRWLDIIYVGRAGITQVA